MSEQQQPKEHCEHEGWCWHQILGCIPLKDGKPKCVREGCSGDTRSRPHTAPALPAFCNGCNNENTTCYECARKDAAISRKAREDVLSVILDCAETDGEWFRIDGTDTLYLNYSVLSKKAESLRSTQQQAGDP